MCDKLLYAEGNAGRVRRIKVAGAYRYRQSWLDDYLRLLEAEQNPTLTTVVPLRPAKRSA